MRYLAYALVLAGSAAHAEPQAYVQGDMMVGFATPVAGPNAMAGVEAGYDLGAVWAHAAMAAGPASDDQGSGYNSKIAGGLEVHGCGSSGVACLLVGIDLGGQHGRWSGDSMSESFTGLVAIPRVFADLGGSTWRFRIGLEASALIAGTGTRGKVGLGRGSGVVGNELVIALARGW